MNTPRKTTFPQWCRRYLANFNLIAIAAVLCYILFFTDTSIGATYTYEKKITRLEREKQAWADTLAFYNDLNSRLDGDKEMIERVAREHYLMKRPHEDVFTAE